MNPKSLIEDLKQAWVEHGGYKPPLVGCTHNDINTIRSKQGVDFLPELYIQFMLSFGRNAGGLKHSGDFTFPKVASFKNEWGQMLPSTNCFVFLTDHDAFALFFCIDGETDPMIRRIDEASSDAEPGLGIEEYCLLSDFLIDWIQSEILVYQKWKNDPNSSSSYGEK